MNADTARHLLALNRQFYQTFALQFSATRQRIQPGVRQVLEQVGMDADLLDLGCGNGELGRVLQARGHRGAYVGLDFSPGLLAEAAGENRAADPPALLVQADLGLPGWEAVLRAELAAHSPEPGPKPPPFDLALAFAVLHHLPGQDLRLQTLGKIHNLLGPGGRFAHSEWQFLNSPRLRARIQPWEAAGLNAADLDPGDYLLDWRHGGSGLRYVHHFDVDELESLAVASGFRVLSSFSSDGEGGNLGLYQWWEKVP